MMQVRKSRIWGAIAGFALFAGVGALAAGIYTNNVPYLVGNPVYNGWTTQAPTSLSGGAFTGNEGVPVDTNLPQGAAPQTAATTLYNLWLGTTSTPANTTSFTATVAQVCGGGKQTLTVTPTAAATITTPTAALCTANLPPGAGTAGLTTGPVGYSWLLKVVDAATVASTFALTMAGGTNVSFVGPVIVAPATSNEYSCNVATATPTVVCTFIGGGL